MRRATLLVLGAAALGALAPHGLVRADDRPGKKGKAPPPSAEHEQRIERARMWAQTLVGKPGFVDRTLAGWNLEALAPESTETLLAVMQENTLAEDALTAACHALGEIGSPQALPFLQKIAESDNQPAGAKLSAMMALAKILNADSAKALAKIAAGPASVNQYVALIVLGKTNEHQLAPILEKVLERKDDPEDRSYAFRAVGHLKDPRFMPQCIAALDDPNEAIRSQAARTLGKIGTPAVADALEKFFGKVEGGTPVHFMVSEALARLGRKKGMDALSVYLQNGEPIYQLAAATSLYEVASPTTLPLFRQVLADTLDGTRPPGPDLMCVSALGVMGDKEALPLFVQALQKGRIELKREAATAIGLLGDKRGTDPLLTAARAPDKRIRATALVALARLNDPRAWSEELAAALRDREASIRYAACVAVEISGEKAAIPSVQALLEDDQDFVSKEAREAIAKLGGKPLTGTPDLRDPLYLDRLRAVEREFLMKIQLANVGVADNSKLAKSAPQRFGTLRIDIVDT